MSLLEEMLRQHIHDIKTSILDNRRDSDTAMAVAVALDTERMRLEELLAKYGQKQMGVRP